MGRTLIIASDPSGNATAGDFFTAGGSYLRLTSTEAEHQAAARIAGHFCFLGGQSIDNTPPGVKLNFRKNGMSGSEVTLIDGWAESPDQDVIASGDLFNIAVTDGTGATDLSASRVLFSADTGHATYHIGWIGAAPPTGTTTYYTLAGYGNAADDSVEEQNQTKYTVGGMLANLQVYVSANNVGADSTITLRINGADTTITRTIGSGETGLFEDTTHTEAISAGDLVSLKVVVGSGGGNLTITFAGVSFAATSGSSSDIFGTTSLHTNNFAGTRYIPIGGYGRIAVEDEDAAKCRVGFPATLSNWYVHVQTNSRASATELTLMVDGVASGLMITIGAGETGWFFDTVHSAVATRDNDLSIKIASAAVSAVFGITAYGFRVTDNGGGIPCNDSTPPVDYETPTTGTDQVVSYPSQTHRTIVRQLNPHPRRPINEYSVGTNERTYFPVSFRVMAEDDLRVSIDGVELVQGDFTFTGRSVERVPGYEGGKLTLATAVSDCVLRIWSAPGISRIGDYDDDEIGAAELNTEFHTLWREDRAQKLQLEQPQILTFDSGHTLAADESGGIFSGQAYTLPAASPGLRYKFVGGSVTKAGADMICDGAGTGSTLTASGDTDIAELICPMTGKWYVARKNGAWGLA